VSLTPVPDLAQLLADPARVAALPPAEARDLLLRLAPLVEDLRLRALHAGVQHGRPVAVEPDRLLGVKEVAARLGRSPDYIYRRRWPFEVKGDGRGRRFSAQGLDRYLRSRQGR